MSSSLQDYYRQRAAEYDRVYQKPERRTEILYLQRWLPQQLTCRNLLDIACGTGYWTQYFSPSVNRTVGIDSSVETIEIARARLADSAHTFVQGNAYQLPFAPNTFDAVFAGFWFSHIPKQSRSTFFYELDRVLHANAGVLLLDNCYVEGSNHAISETDQHTNTFQTRQLADGSEHRVLKNFPTDNELRELLQPFAKRLTITRLRYYWVCQYTTRC